MIAISFLVDDKSAGAKFGSSTPLAAWFNNMGNVSFGMMLPILSGFIAMSIAERPGLAVGFAGGLLAKSGATFLDPSAAKVAATPGFLADYIVLLLKKLFKGLPKSLEGVKPILLYSLLGVFCMAVFASAINPLMSIINQALTNFLSGLGNYGIILGVVAGGMVPPLAIALSTTFFKNKWTEDERNAGLVNYIMGLSFISEGAIPFAANDPIHVIPSCVISSAVAGGLSVVSNCQLRAPHGGVFVIAIVSNWPLYLLAIAAGSVVGCLILSTLKKAT